MLRLGVARIDEIRKGGQRDRGTAQVEHLRDKVRGTAKMVWTCAED